MAGEILIYAEHRDGHFKKASLECVSQGKRMAQALGTQAVALAAGKDLGGAADTLAAYGADRVLLAQSDALDPYRGDVHARAVAKAARELSARAVLLPASANGRDLAPRIGALLDVPVAVDCTSVEVTADAFRVQRPIYGSKAVVTLKLERTPAVASLRPNVFAADGPAEGATAETAALDVSDLAPSALTLKETIAARSDKPDLTEADRIVSGGRGLKGAEHWQLILDLADAVGAVPGASRAVVDAGWRPHSEQVGQTGKTVAPTLYIAAGISGAIQHLAGMSSSKCIVAINKDPEAPIFKVANYGIVGDAFEVLPALTEAFKKVLADS